MFGVLPIDKPAGRTSRDVVNHVQRILGKRRTKVGHTGTLDPLATGVLLVCVGPATRLTEFAHAAEKQYRATFELDVFSDTLDADAEIKRVREPRRPTQQQWEDVACTMLGTIEQTPPAYSAVQIGGRRAYAMARAGKTVELPPRRVYIHALRTTRFDYPLVEVEIVCSTGTYVRTLGDDMAKKLGTRSVMRSLQRVRIGSIGVQQCAPLDAITDVAAIKKHLFPATELLVGIPRVELDAELLAAVANGRSLTAAAQDYLYRKVQQVSGSGHAPAVRPADRRPGSSPPMRVAVTDAAGRLAAVVERQDDGAFRPIKVFPRA